MGAVELEEVSLEIQQVVTEESSSLRLPKKEAGEDW
jgi:hypothetical protein